jgi:putative lipoprotein
MASRFGLQRCRGGLQRPQVAAADARAFLHIASCVFRAFHANTGRAFPAVLSTAVFFLIACTSVAVPAATGVLRGEATYWARMMPPPNAVLVVTLEDVSRADAPPREIASAQMALKSGPPYAWRMAYDKEAVDGLRHVLRARILVDGKLFMSTDQSVPALSDDAAKLPNLLMRRVQSRPVEVPLVASDVALQGTYWKLTQLGGVALPAAAGGAPEAHIVLHAEGRLAGSDGCNRMTGNYTIEAAQMWFERLGGTKMACPAISGADSAFIRALLVATAWRITGNTLELMAGREPVARFAAVAMQ